MRKIKGILAILLTISLILSVVPVFAESDIVDTILTLELEFDTQPDKIFTDDVHMAKVYYTAILTDADGNPVPDAKIYIGDSGNINIGYSRKTDENGKMTFKSYFPEGEYDVYVQFKGGVINDVNYAEARDEKPIVIIDQPKPIIYDKDIRSDRNNDGKIYNLNENIEFVIGIPRPDSELHYIVGTTAENLITPLAYFRYKARTEGNVFYLASDYQGVYIPKAKATVTPSIEGSPNVIWENTDYYNVTTALGWETASAVFYVYPEEGYEILPENIFVNKTDNGRTKYVDVVEYDPESGRLFLDGVSLDVNVYVKATPIAAEAPVEEQQEDSSENEQQISDVKGFALSSAGASAPLLKDGTEDENAETVTATEPQSSDGVYQISNAGELLWFAEKVNSSVKGEEYSAINGSLTDDIDLSGVEWTPIGSNANSNSYKRYNGTFDGNGHTISNLNIEATIGYVGLFGYASSNAKISNITLKNTNISTTASTANIGTLLGYSNGAAVSNITVENVIVTSTGSNTGGIVGYATNTLTNASIDELSIVTGKNYTGGIVGKTSGDLTKVYNYGAAVIGNDYVGGITGQANKIDESYNNGNVTGKERVGGITGYIGSSGRVSNSLNTGDVTGDTSSDFVSGIAGINSNNGELGIQNAVNIGTVVNTSGKAHAIASTNNVSNSYYYNSSEGLDGATDKSGSKRITDSSNIYEIVWKLNSTEVITKGESAVNEKYHSGIWSVKDNKPALVEANTGLSPIYRVSFKDGDSVISNVYTTENGGSVQQLPQNTPDEKSDVQASTGVVYKQIFEGWYNNGKLINVGVPVTENINAEAVYKKINIKAVHESDRNVAVTFEGTTPYLAFPVSIEAEDESSIDDFEFGAYYSTGTPKEGLNESEKEEIKISDKSDIDITTGDLLSFGDNYSSHGNRYSIDFKLAVDDYTTNYVLVPYIRFTDAYGHLSDISVGVTYESYGSTNLYSVAENLSKDANTSEKDKTKLNYYVISVVEGTTLDPILNTDFGKDNLEFDKEYNLTAYSQEEFLLIATGYKVSESGEQTLVYTSSVNSDDLTFTVPEDSNADIVKVFLWNSSTLKPLLPVTKKTISAAEAE